MPCPCFGLANKRNPVIPRSEADRRQAEATRNLPSPLCRKKDFRYARNQDHSTLGLHETGGNTMSRTVGVLVMEHIAAGLVEGHKVIGPLKLFPESPQSLDPLQSMPSGDITEAIRGLVEKVAGAEKIEAVGIGFPGIIQSGVVEE